MITIYCIHIFTLLYGDEHFFKISTPQTSYTKIGWKIFSKKNAILRENTTNWNDGRYQSLVDVKYKSIFNLPLHGRSLNTNIKFSLNMPFPRTIYLPLVFWSTIPLQIFTVCSHSVQFWSTLLGEKNALSTSNVYKVFSRPKWNVIYGNCSVLLN